MGYVRSTKISEVNCGKTGHKIATSSADRELNNNSSLTIKANDSTLTESENIKATNNCIKETLPCFLLAITAAQIIFHYVLEEYEALLSFSPLKRHQIWRYITPALVHLRGRQFLESHLWNNVAPQILLGWKLEQMLSWKRFSAVFLTSVLFGHLVLSVVSPFRGALGSSTATYGLMSATFVRYLIVEWKPNEWKCKIVCIIFVTSVFESIFVTLCPDVQLQVYAECFTGAIHAIALASALFGQLGSNLYDDIGTKLEIIQISVPLIGAPAIDFTFPSQRLLRDPSTAHYSHVGGAFGGFVASVVLMKAGTASRWCSDWRSVAYISAIIIVGVTIPMNIVYHNILHALLADCHGSMFSEEKYGQFQSLANTSSECFSHVSWN